MSAITDSLAFHFAQKSLFLIKTIINHIEIINYGSCKEYIRNQGKHNIYHHPRYIGIPRIGTDGRKKSKCPAGYGK